MINKIMRLIALFLAIVFISSGVVMAGSQVYMWQPFLMGFLFLIASKIA